MLESKLNLNFDLVEQARNHASKVADDTQRFIDRHTTVAVERTVCRLLGIDGIWLAVTAAELAALAVSAAMLLTKDKVFHYRKA